MNRRTDSGDDDSLREAAARWTVRRDRGLSAAESVEYELWLAADPRHRAAMARTGDAWGRLDRIPDKLAQRVLDEGRRRRRWWRLAAAGTGSLAAAAALALVFFPAEHGGPAETPARAAPASLALQAVGPRLVALADGTAVRLNAGSAIVERFSAAERVVELTRGEAHFTVTKDPARPFVVSAGGLRVRAVGTAFNVSRVEARTEVLVTEGRVALLAEPVGQRPEAGSRGPKETSPVAAAEGLPGAIAELGAGERAVVTLPSPGEEAVNPRVALSRVDAAEMARTLAWQDNLLRLGGATLAEIAAEFERRTGHRVVIADPALAGLRLGGRFRADDAEGFAKLLGAMLDVEAERGADGAIVLRKKN
jgi:transmembrane sensor